MTTPIPIWKSFGGTSLRFDGSSEPRWKPSKHGNDLWVAVTVDEDVEITVLDDAGNDWVRFAPNIWMARAARSASVITINASRSCLIEAQAQEAGTVKGMKDVKGFVAGVCAKLADILARSEAIKQEAVSICLEVVDYAKEFETLPPSDDRDLFIATLARLKAALCELGAIPPASLTVADGGTERE